MEKQSKFKYLKPNIDIINFKYADIITNSACDNDRKSCVFDDGNNLFNWDFKF